ncbi:blue-light photoreceptor PHR2 [Ananas comosus]|uniref:Blue-light photoreceptor PHR2 n=1 Tax=Ananas comosus TaxID=4615 RepID=A0A6P5GT06_ANACO|nr:blue-light photoreceptor PHR2 [Ananas comosus]
MEQTKPLLPPLTSPQTLETLETLESQSPSQEEEHLKPLPIASLSLSLSSLLSLASKPSPPTLSSFKTRIKIPSQITSLAHLSSSSPKPPRRSSSAAAASLLRAPSQLLRRPPADPRAGAAAGRRCGLVWFRADLRVHDNEALAAASDASLSLLPVYLFDPRDYGRSSSGFDRTGPYRAAFLRDSVADLRRRLRARGSDLVVRIGRPEVVLPEVRAEERVAKAMEKEGVEVKYFWGSTLYHVDDLPFDLDRMPSTYGSFREKVQGVAVRRTIEALDQIKGLPKRGGVEPGEIPTLAELGLNPAPAMSQDGKPAAVTSSLVGGETEALERLKKFAAECSMQPKKGDKDSTRDSIYGANFSCKISPWLATGCLSPRFMYEELKKTATKAISAATNQKNGAAGSDNGMNWLMFELLWRDFFRFITKKYSTGKNAEVEPATACTGALA